MGAANYKMPFGSHKGKTLQTIFNADPTYLEWMRDTLDGKAQEMAIEFLREQNRKIIVKGKKK